MSSIKFAKPLRLQPKPSKILIALLTLGHIGAIAVLIPLDLSLLIKLAIGLFIMVSLVVAWHKQPGQVGEGGVQTLTWQAGGGWLLETLEGEQIKAQLHESTYVHPWLVVLNFRQENKPGLLSFTFAPDALDRETFRELRARLKLAGNVRESD